MMLGLIPLPYKILAGLLILLAIVTIAEYDGYKRSDAKWTAKTLAAERAAQIAYQAEVKRGNDLSARLAQAENNVQVNTVEKIRYVTKVTTGKPCLNADAVALINRVSDLPNGHTESNASGKPVAESAGSSATDANITEWAIIAHGYYDTCALRLNTLIDFETGQVIQ
jgi:hypothetical protein